MVGQDQYFFELRNGVLCERIQGSTARFSAGITAF